MKAESGAIVHRKKSGKLEFLIVRKLHSKGGHWDFPKGKMNDGEKPEETAIREVNEETGLVITIIEGFREEYLFDYREETYKVNVFLATTYTPTVKIDINELIDYKWLSFEDAIIKLTHQGSKNVLSKAKEFLEKK